MGWRDRWQPLARPVGDTRLPQQARSPRTTVRCLRHCRRPPVCRDRLFFDNPYPVWCWHHHYSAWQDHSDISHNPHRRRGPAPRTATESTMPWHGALKSFMAPLHVRSAVLARRSGILISGESWLLPPITAGARHGLVTRGSQVLVDAGCWRPHPPDRHSNPVPSSRIPRTPQHQDSCRRLVVGQLVILAHPRSLHSLTRISMATPACEFPGRLHLVPRRRLECAAGLGARATCFAVSVPVFHGRQLSLCRKARGRAHARAREKTST